MITAPYLPTWRCRREYRIDYLAATAKTEIKQGLARAEVELNKSLDNIDARLLAGRRRYYIKYIDKILDEMLADLDMMGRQQ